MVVASHKEKKRKINAKQQRKKEKNNGKGKFKHPKNVNLFHVWYDFVSLHKVHYVHPHTIYTYAVHMHINLYVPKV